MDRRLFAAGVALTQILIPFRFSAGADTPSAEDTALLKTLITQNEATVQKIESSPLFVDFSWRNTLLVPPLPGGNGKTFGGSMVVEGKSRYWRHGRSFHQDKDFKNTWTDTGEVRDGSVIFMINERYAAQYSKPAKELYIFPFGDRDKLYPAVANQMENYPSPDIMEFGFRFSTSNTLRQAFEENVRANPSHSRWTPAVSEANGGQQYTIISEVPLKQGSFMLQAETTLDSESGFLISESRTYDATGTAFYVVTSQFESVGDGAWFPRSGVRKIIGSDDTLTIQVNEIRLGDPNIEEKFTLEAMNIDREETIMYEYSNNAANRVMKGFFEGKWIPFDQLPRERKEVIQRAHSAPSGAATSSPSSPQGITP